MTFKIRDTIRKAARAAGQKTYQGVPCTRGHNGLRYVANKQCVECSALRGKAWMAERPWMAAEYSRKWRESNRDAHRAHGRKWVAANRERVNAASLEYHKNNPEKGRLNQRNRRARMASADGSHNGDDVAFLLKAQGHRCAYCRVDLKRRRHEVDHIKALSKGGANYRRNLQILCVSCNRSKRNQDPIIFAQQRGMLL